MREGIDVEFVKITRNVHSVPAEANGASAHVVTSGGGAVVVDPGAGAFLDSLDQIGVRRVEWALFTHYHRDSCAAAAALADAGVPLAAPARESGLFERVDKVWRHRSPFDVYYFKPTFFCLPRPVSLSAKLKGGDVLEWSGPPVRVLDTPGHTTGSLTYVLDAGEVQLAFTGDALHAGGKVWTYHDLQYWYNDNGEGGFRRLLKSLKRLERLARRKATWLLPCHGPPERRPLEAIRVLRERIQAARAALGSRFSSVRPMDQFRAFFHKKLKPVRLDREFPHLVQDHRLLPRTTFLVFSRGGDRAFVVDFGGGGDLTTTSERRLFQLLAARGVAPGRVDFAFPTHYHDDHVGGLARLQRVHGVKVWAVEQLVDVLANPTHYRMACLTDSSLRVDRVLRDGEEFDWGGWSFQAFHFPGQTEFHAGLLAEIDGRRLFFAGDSVVETTWWDRRTNLNCWNWCRLGPNVGYAKCASLLLELEPEFVALSHVGVLKVDRDLLERFARIVSRYFEVVADLLPHADPNFGFDPNWLCFKPAWVKVPRGGATFTLAAVARNYGTTAAWFSLEPGLPGGWEASPERVDVEVPAGQFAEVPFRVDVPPKASPGRHVLVGNAWWDGAFLGPVLDAIVDHGIEPADDWTAWNPERGCSLFSWVVRQQRNARRFFDPP
ncbi:MAG: hypothetical protein Kow0069_38970 [Promethearchaeota archaeon]